MNKKLPTKTETTSISTANIGASCGARTNSKHIVPVTCKQTDENMDIAKLDNSISL